MRAQPESSLGSVPFGSGSDRDAAAASARPRLRPGRHTTSWGGAARWLAGSLLSGRRPASAASAVWAAAVRAPDGATPSIQYEAPRRRVAQCVTRRESVTSVTGKCDPSAPARWRSAPAWPRPPPPPAPPPSAPSRCRAAAPG